MKTLEQVYEMFQGNTLDGRDVNRLADFIPESDLHRIGAQLKPEYVGTHQHKPFTRENVLEQLKSDVDFGFYKALNQRSISASLMFEVVRMWNWILEEGLEDWDEDSYSMYGLPLFKATAVKYGFENPIGDDNGDEDKYGSY